MAHVAPLPGDFLTSLSTEPSLFVNQEAGLPTTMAALTQTPSYEAVKVVAEELLRLCSSQSRSILFRKAF